MRVTVTSDTGLLERDSQLAAAEALLEAAIGGVGGVLVVEASPGLGKTSLLGVMTENARRRGFGTLVARGSEFEREFAFGVVRQLLERPVSALPATERAAVLSGAAGLAAGVLGLGDRQAPREGLDALFHGLYWLVAALAERCPVMVCVDDAQWADQESANWLLYLSRRVEGLPAVLAVSARPPSDTLGTSPLAALAADPRVCCISLPPLTTQAASTLVRARLGVGADEEFCRACHAAAAGNPFVLNELVADLEARGVEPVAATADDVAALAPEKVARSVLARIGRLSPHAAELATAAAILREGALLRDAAELADLSISDATVAADELVGADILGGIRPLQFIHPLVRGAIYTATPPGQRASAHARAADVLSATGAPIEDVAGHLLRAEPAGRPEVVARLRAAAADATARGAAAVSAGYLRRALLEPPSAYDHLPVLRDLGAAESTARLPEALDHLEAAFRLAPDPPSRAEQASVLARELDQRGRIREAAAVLEAAQSALDPDSERELWVRLEVQRLGAARQGASSVERAWRELTRLDADAPADSPAQRALIVQLAVHASFDGSHGATWTAQLAERALTAGLIDDQPTDWQVVKQAINVLVHADLLQRALAWYDRALDAARTRGSALGAAIMLSQRAQAQYRLGHIVDADADASAALDMSPDDWLLRPATLGYLIEARTQQDLIAAAAVVAAVPPELELSESWYVNPLLNARARLRLESGDPKGALNDWLDCGRRLESWRMTNPTWIAWRTGAALANRAMGDTHAAHSLAVEELELARSYGAPRAIGTALRAVGLLEGGEHGLSALKEAVDVLAASAATLDHAHALTDLGATLRRNRHRTDARELLQQAVDLAYRCGGTRLVGRATTELRAAGGRPRTLLRRGVDALTPSELRIAQMAAGGMSNPAIAQALFVTTKTVEMHLSAVYRKLQLESRSQLNSILGDTVEPDE